MLPLRSISRLPRPLQPSHARHLTTYPKPIPTYRKQWDPTKHTLRPVIPVDTARDDARRDERAELLRSQKLEGSLKDIRTHPARADIWKFYRLMRSVDSERIHSGIRLKLWRTYRRLKERFPEVLLAMPDRAWDILWEVQKREVGPSKSSHVEELQRDMVDCGGYEPVGKRIQYLDELFSNGKEEQALREWKEEFEGGNKRSRHDLKPEYLELGARMYAFSGSPDLARQVMYDLYDLYPSWNPSIMKVVFRALTSSTLAQHHDSAKKIYKLLKQNLGEEITREDYDACFVGFLEARHLSYAMQVFTDMVKEGHLAASYSPDEVEGTLLRLHRLYLLATDIAKMTNINLKAISALPPAYHPHVFSHWMRSAVVQSAPAAGAQVFDLMRRRGYQPQTVHFNLLLKVFMRFGAKQYLEDSPLGHRGYDRDPHVMKAENIGWQMIEEFRKAYVEKLPHVPASELISNWNNEKKDVGSDDEDIKEFAKANVTTFAIMIKHHSTKLQWEHVDYLARQLNESGLWPNTELMNALMDTKCLQGKYFETWNIYKSMTDEPPAGTPGVFPDGASIRCLWKTLRLALGNSSTRDSPDLPRPRELLAETVQWWTRVTARPDADRFLLGLAATDHGAISTLMMHCFSYTGDLAGSLVGLHVLRKKFGISPVPKAAAILQQHAAWFDMRNKTELERQQFHHSGVYKQNVEKLGSVYHILMDRRWERMGITGDEYAKLNAEEVEDVGLDLLSEFIRVVMKRSHPPERVENMINQAKEEAGVPEMSTGDLDAFQVA